MKRIRVFYTKNGIGHSTIVTAETGFDASEYVRSEYGPCTVTGVEYL